MPEDEAVFQRDDYSDIYLLKKSDTINKFNGIDGVEIDKFELSKFLGKYLRIGGMIKDKVESRFEKDILKIFNYHVIIENYSAWEKIVEILIINERFKALESFCKKVNEAIDAIRVTEDVDDTLKENVAGSLYTFLHACLCRNFGLVWKPTREETERSIYESFLTKKAKGDKDKLIEGYCKSRMLDKSVMPILYDMLTPETFCISSEVNLTRFAEVINSAKDEWDTEYKYYPYMIGMYEINIVTCIEKLKACESTPFENLDNLYKEEINRYVNANYRCEAEYGKKQYGQITVVKAFENPQALNSDYYCVSVGSAKKQKLRIAIANAKLSSINFERSIKNNPDRSYQRYENLSQIINESIKQNVDLLIMPEAYVPFEWLATIARTCARNNLGIVAGIEHVILNDSVFNLTAVILPYSEENHMCAHISFHLKRHYAPSEIEKINGYRLAPVEGKNYEIYKWNDCYFPVYCCYELASITDRSMFQSYADMIIAVEWNRDVRYYSNILESLSRDIHCYCIQVNSSDYGDSRITKPSKSEEKDIIRTKGGINSCILTEEISISKLRDFQLKEYSLQQKDNLFKVTPPNFDKDIVLKKIKGEDLFNLS